MDLPEQPPLKPLSQSTALPGFLPLLILPESIGITVTSSDSFTWHISDWSALCAEPSNRTYSAPFTIAGSLWRILLFPNGNRSPDTIAVFLESLTASETKTENWHLWIHAPGDLERYKVQQANHRFTSKQTDWGFNNMIRRDVLADYVDEEGGVCIAVFLNVIEDATGVLWHDFVNYDSKKETGYVGLRNQGATCYMNSLLQSLYFTSTFRRAVCQIPTEDDSPSNSIALALQRIFFNLMCSEAPVGTTELTQSFGWDTLDSFMQHDVQEFNRVLQDNLETKMKGTMAEGAISGLFVGKMKSYIKCIDVDFESSRIEDFYDVQLNVKGCKDLNQSFVDYCEIETLDGENQYQAEGFGKQDARKGVVFKGFPPVLHLQLKRFEYDMEHDAMVKINDRHEFPLELELEEYLDDDADRSVGTLYSLHGGDLSAGHYMAFIRPSPDGKWFKYDDDRVTPVTQKEALDDNYGEVPGRPRNNRRATVNAYMLVYVRKDDVGDVLGEVSMDDIPVHLKERLKKERVEGKRVKREAEEQHLYVNVTVVCDLDIGNNVGFDLYGFQEGGDAVVFKVLKSDTLAMFRETVSQRFELGAETFRLWNMAQRRNMSIRPEHPFTEVGEIDMMNDLYELIIKNIVSADTDLRLYLELPDVELSVDRLTLDADGASGNGYIVFLKYYDAHKGRLEYCGKLSVGSRKDKIGSIVGIMLGRIGLAEGTPLVIYEEVKVGCIELLKTGDSFAKAEIGDGDILVFQKALTDDETDTVPPGNVLNIPEYFEYLADRVTVILKQFPTDTGIDLKEHVKYKLTLNKRMGYDDVAYRVASVIGVSDPKCIRFTASNSVGLPKSVVKRTEGLVLGDMMSAGVARGVGGSIVLFFEKLENPVTLKRRGVRVIYSDARLNQHGPFEVGVPTAGVIHDVVVGAKERVGVALGMGVRVFEMRHGRVHRIFKGDEGVGEFVEGYGVLVVQEEVEHEVGCGQVLGVVHYNGEVTWMHGIPFDVAYTRGEDWGAVRERIRVRGGWGAKDWAKIGVRVFDEVGGEVVEIGDKEEFEDGVVGLDHIERGGK